MQEASISRSAPLEAMSTLQERTAMGNTYTGTFFNDTINLEPGGSVSGGVTISFGVGPVTQNVINGGFGNDDLNGGAGDDTLNGGFGSDTLTGGFGVGTDTFVYTTIFDSLPFSPDTITDFDN